MKIFNSENEKIYKQNKFYIHICNNKFIMITGVFPGDQFFTDENNKLIGQTGAYVSDRNGNLILLKGFNKHTTILNISRIWFYNFKYKYITSQEIAYKLGINYECW